jgi:hypothetical protein
MCGVFAMGANGSGFRPCGQRHGLALRDLELHRGQRLGLRELQARHVAEGQRRAERDARAGVVAAHDAGRVVAHGIQALDGLAVGVEHAGLLVGDETGEGADVAHDQPDGVVRAVLQRRHARVGRDVGVALVAVVGLAALAEERVFPGGGGLVELLHGGFEHLRRNADLLGQLADARAALQVAALQVAPDGQRRRRDAAQAVVAQRLVVAQQPRRDLGLALAGLDHRLHEVVVRVAFVGKALALGRDRDHAGLGAVDEVGHHALGAVGARGDRCGHPRGGMRNGAVDAPAHGLGQAQAVAGVGGRRWRVVLLAGGRVREQLLAALHVVGEAAAGQHHAALGRDTHRLALVLHHRARDAVVVDHELGHGRGQPHGNVEVHRGLGQAARQRVAVGQRHAAAVAQHVEEVAGQPLGDVPERGGRLEGPHEVFDLGARAQHHSEHRELGQRRRQLLHARTEFAAVERARDHRAAALLAAGRFGVVVGEHGRHVELHAGVAREEVDGLGAHVEKGADARRVEVRGGLVPHVGQRGAFGLVDALLRGQARARNPQPAARARGGAAEARLLVDHQHLQPLRRRRDGGGHARCTAADDEHIAFKSVLFHLCLSCLCCVRLKLRRSLGSDVDMVKSFSYYQTISHHRLIMTISVETLMAILAPTHIPHAGRPMEKPRRGIQSIEIGTQLLVALGRHVAPMALRDLGKSAGIPVGKAHPYLVSFLKVGFVVQDSAGRYELGPLALQLGLAKLQRLDPIKEASPLIEALASETEQSIAVAVWGNFGPTVVRLEEPIHPLHVNLRTGTVMSLAYTATGRLFAAYLPPKVVEK